MYFTKTQYFAYQTEERSYSCFYIPVKCSCGNSPAVSFEADCHGDALTLCKECWKKWFENELLPLFDKNLEEDFYKIEATPKMLKDCVWLKDFKEAIYKRKG